MKKSNYKKVEPVLIERYSTPNFKSFITILPKNKNFWVIRNVDRILKKNNKTWPWLLKNIEIPEKTFNIYFGGKHNISLGAIQKMCFVLGGFVKSPKELMNRRFPVLKNGRNFNLNIKEIQKKYGITNGEIVIGVGIDRGALSNISHGKVKQLRKETLVNIFKFLKRRGVPLRYPLDLIYFPNCNEGPLQFIKRNSRKALVYKFNSKIQNIRVENLKRKL